MKANKVWFFSDLMEKNKRVFKVPVYQRNYDWSNIQCEKLYKDIMIASEKQKQHFTGTIVYIEEVNGGSGLNEVLIIDGQQRITTMYILLKALYDASKGEYIRIENELTDVMFNRNCDDKYKVKLKPVKSDNEQLLYLVNDKFEKIDKNSNVYKSYMTFKDLIEESISEGLSLSDILEGIKKLEIVEIILDKSQGDEPQKIFESINSTGLELSLADLIRNYLLMDNENQDKLYSDYWLEIEKNVGYKNLGDFVINYINSQVSKSVNSKNAYECFKNDCEEKSISNEDLLKKLTRTSMYYGVFIGESNYYSEKIQFYLHSFNAIKQTTVLPLIFRIFDDFEDEKITEETLCKVLEYLLTYIIRIISCDINKNLAKFMKSFYIRALKDSNNDTYYSDFASFINNTKSNDRMPNDKEFRDALIYKPIYKKNICKYILYSIENSTKEQIDMGNLTIEHILPQKENAAVWKKVLGENYDKVYEIFLHTLGNLTITGYNRELGTKSFDDKKKIIKEVSKVKILNEDVLSSKVWNEEAIINRANNLVNIIIKRFPYVPINSNLMDKEKSSFSIAEGMDFTNTKPNSFSFMGEHTKVKTWSDLLKKFIDIAYDLDNDLFVKLAKNNYSLDNAKRSYITNDNGILRRGREIEKSGIYFETNLSSNNIVNFIRDLIKNMNLDVNEFRVSLL